MATAPLRMPTLAAAALSMCLSIAIIGCAGRTFSVFNAQQTTNAWLLPIWPDHFDTSELRVLIGTSAAIVFLNALLISAQFTVALPRNVVILSASLLSLACSIIAIAFTTVINQQAPTRDTLQTWTCRWNRVDVSGIYGPSGFGAICDETRFAFFTTIPVFLIQLLLVSSAVYALVVDCSKGPARLGSDAEKGHSQHELANAHNGSFDTKSAGSLVSANGSLKVGMVSTKGVEALER
ncbi:hypothetical protein Tdes44962_MAKER00799 [Teratosphaeria destructans]|uniref:Uncharacterized protein n=1 Tax=Teratosphaeria destructans TaxID=418781 RepID=A0A9W7SKJ7_9PEZI|nr:hypothetical protein Tdes44962_MAKER00799 [Teratosphaeria destructans]